MNQPAVPAKHKDVPESRAFDTEPRDFADVRAQAAHALLRFFIPTLGLGALLASAVCAYPVFYPARVVICVCVGATTIAPWWQRRRGHPLKGIAYLLAMLTLVLVAGTLANGGPRAPAYTALIIVPVMAVWFVSTRVIVSFILGMLALGLLSAKLLESGVLPAKPLPAGTFFAAILSVITGVVGVVLVTVSRLLREALITSRDSSNLMKSMFSAIDDTVLLLDTDFGIADEKVSASDRTKGLDRAYFARIMNHHLGPEHGELSVREFLKENLTSSHPQRVLVKLSSEAGTPRYHDFTAAMLSSSESRRRGIVVLLRDVTEQETQRERWARAQKMDAIGRLASGVAHDFNNLLTGIQASAEFLAEDASSSQMELLDIILGSSERAALLTRRLLLHARNSTEDTLKPLNVDDLIKESIGLLGRSFDRKIEISTLFSSKRMYVNADATTLQGTFLNLAINAAQAMPEGGLLKFKSSEQHLDDQAAARVHASLYPGKYAIIEVTDTGHGIPIEVQEKIFNPFFTTKPAGKGTGLGLSTAMDSVRRIGGFLTVQSVQDVGSTFTIYLPIVDGGLVPKEWHKTDDRLLPSAGASIMIIDDEPAIRRSLSLALMRFGYHVETFRHGAEALARLAHEIPDLIVLDMIMPGMSGQQVFDQVQRLKHPPPVILTTGYAESDDISSMIDQGLFSVIRKPYRAQNVGVEIERALASRKSPLTLAARVKDESLGLKTHGAPLSAPVVRS